MVDDYFLAAQNLATRNKNRLNKNRSTHKQELDSLFYWVLDRLSWRINSSYPAEREIFLTLYEIPILGSEHVRLEDRNHAHYTSEFVKTKAEFYEIMQEVADIFDEFNSNPDLDCEYYSYCKIVPDESILTVNMHTL